MKMKMKNERREKIFYKRQSQRENELKRFINQTIYDADIQASLSSSSLLSFSNMLEKREETKRERKRRRSEWKHRDDNNKIFCDVISRQLILFLIILGNTIAQCTECAKLGHRDATDVASLNRGGPILATIQTILNRNEFFNQKNSMQLNNDNNDNDNHNEILYYNNYDNNYNYNDNDNDNNDIKIMKFHLKKSSLNHHDQAKDNGNASGAGNGAGNVGDFMMDANLNGLGRITYENIYHILRGKDENESSPPPVHWTDMMVSLVKMPHKRSTLQPISSAKLDLKHHNLTEFLWQNHLQSNQLNSVLHIDLSGNYLNRIDFHEFQRVRYLNLSYNNLTSVPLTENSSLVSLNLNYNQIQASSIKFNLKLRELYLKGNQIQRLSSLNLSALPNLEILDLSENLLQNFDDTTFFPQIMNQLKMLNLANNHLISIYRETFYNLINLNTLILSWNNIENIDFEAFLSLANLQYLDLSANRLKGTAIRALQGITGLEVLSIAYNNELGPNMQEFVASWSLKELDGSATGLCHIPAALAQSVRSFKLTNNWLKIINCGDLDSYPLLQYLDLSFSRIEHIEDDALGRLEILQTLMLDHNYLDKIPLSLPTSLEHLFLQNNQIMDLTMQNFQNLNRLQTLDLSNNKLLYLPALPLNQLETLNLQNNEIKGISQTIIYTMAHLNDLMLEGNPIKCSDLMGIAEWASICRLPSQLATTNASNENDPNNPNSGTGESKRNRSLNDDELKGKCIKMHDFYEAFDSNLDLASRNRRQGHPQQHYTMPSCVHPPAIKKPIISGAKILQSQKEPHQNDSSYQFQRGPTIVDSREAIQNIAAGRVAATFPNATLIEVKALAKKIPHAIAPSTKTILIPAIVQGTLININNWKNYQQHQQQQQEPGHRSPKKVPQEYKKIDSGIHSFSQPIPVTKTLNEIATTRPQIGNILQQPKEILIDSEELILKRGDQMPDPDRNSTKMNDVNKIVEIVGDNSSSIIKMMKKKKKQKKEFLKELMPGIKIAATAKTTTTTTESLGVTITPPPAHALAMGPMKIVKVLQMQGNDSKLLEMKILYPTTATTETDIHSSPIAIITAASAAPAATAAPVATIAAPTFAALNGNHTITTIRTIKAAGNSKSDHNKMILRASSSSSLSSSSLATAVEWQKDQELEWKEDKIEDRYNTTKAIMTGTLSSSTSSLSSSSLATPLSLPNKIMTNENDRRMTGRQQPIKSNKSCNNHTNNHNYNHNNNADDNDDNHNNNGNQSTTISLGNNDTSNSQQNKREGLLARQDEITMENVKVNEKNIIGLKLIRPLKEITPRNIMKVIPTATVTPKTSIHDELEESTETAEKALNGEELANDKHKHEPLRLSIKDRHLIGTPLLMHKGTNLMVTAEELILLTKNITSNSNNSSNNNNGRDRDKSLDGNRMKPENVSQRGATPMMMIEATEFPNHQLSDTERNLDESQIAKPTLITYNHNTKNNSKSRNSTATIAKISTGKGNTATDNNRANLTNSNDTLIAGKAITTATVRGATTTTADAIIVSNDISAPASRNSSEILKPNQAMATMIINEASSPPMEGYERRRQQHQHRYRESFKPTLIMKQMTVTMKQRNVQQMMAPSGSQVHNRNDNGNIAASNGNEAILKSPFRDARLYQELKPIASNRNNDKNSKGNSTGDQHLTTEFLNENENEIVASADVKGQQQHQQQRQQQQQSIVVLVTSLILFAGLLVGLMHVYRCTIPWRHYGTVNTGNSSSNGSSKIVMPYQQDHYHPHPLHQHHNQLHRNEQQQQKQQQSLRPWHHSQSMEVEEDGDIENGDACSFLNYNRHHKHHHHHHHHHYDYQHRQESEHQDRQHPNWLASYQSPVHSLRVRQLQYDTEQQDQQDQQEQQMTATTTTIAATATMNQKVSNSDSNERQGPRHDNLNVIDYIMPAAEATVTATAPATIANNIYLPLLSYDGNRNHSRVRAPAVGANKPTVKSVSLRTDRGGMAPVPPALATTALDDGESFYIEMAPQSDQISGRKQLDDDLLPMELLNMTTATAATSQSQREYFDQHENKCQPHHHHHHHPERILHTTQKILKRTTGSENVRQQQQAARISMMSTTASQANRSSNSSNGNTIAIISTKQLTPKTRKFFFW